MESRASRGSVQLDRGDRERDRPKQSGSSDARLPVVLLLRRIAHGARVVEIDSHKAKCTFAAAPIQTHVSALHESHVGIEVPDASVATVGLAADLRSSDYASEVRDRRHLKADTGYEYVHQWVLRD